MIPQTGTILCVEVDGALLVKRCAILTKAGYTAVSADPSEAAGILQNRVFDIVVTVGLSGNELSRLCDVAQRAVVLSVDESTPATLLLFLVDERLRQLRVQVSRTTL